MAKKRSSAPRAAAAPVAGAAPVARSPFLFPSLIAAAGALVYANSLGAPFIFDDRYHIVENLRIRHFSPIEIISHSSRPVIHLSLALNYAIGGLNPAGYHAFNIAVHIAAALVLYGIIRRTLLTPRLRQRWEGAATVVAGLAALIWVVHPLQTEGVTYTVQRGESMMGLFYLLTLYCTLRSDGGDRERWWQAGAVAACLLGLACKGVMATAPVVVLLYDRAFLAKSWTELLYRRKWLYAALLCTLLVYPVMLAQAPEEWKESAGFDYVGLSPMTYALTQATVILHYLRLAVWPAGLCLDYGWPAQTGARAALAAILVLGLVGLCVWVWRRDAALGFAGAWFFLILIPTSSFIPIADVAVEHRMYLSLAALAVLGVAAIAKAAPNYVWTACGAVILALGTATVRRNSDYASELTMWQETVRVSPENPRAQYDLGSALEHAGQVQDAILHYKTAVELKPRYAEALTNLGHLLSTTGKPADAVWYLERAIDVQPKLAQAHSNLGHAFAMQNRNAEAKAQFEEALRLKPDNADAHNNLAIEFALGGNMPEAMAHWEQALRIDPQLADTHNNLAYALGQAGRIRKAIAHYDQALRLKPDYLQAQIGAARVLAAAAAADGGDPQRAIALAEAVTRATGNRDSAALDVLALAYAAAGRLPDAARTAEIALPLARQQGNGALASELEARAARYRAGQR